MQKGLRLKSLKFFTGMEDYEESNAVPEEKMYSVLNARFNGKVVSSKNGYQRLGKSAGAFRVQGVYEYPYFDGTDTEKRLIRFANKAFSRFDNSTSDFTTAIPTTWHSVADAYTDSVNYNNVLYVVNPMEADVDGVGKIDNGTFSVVANSPKGIAIESWAERIWIVGDRQAPNAVIGSRAADMANPLYVEDFDTTDGAVAALIGKGGRCVAIRNLNNNFYVFKNDSIWYNTPDRVVAGKIDVFIELSRTGGAVNQKSTIVVENDVWFLTPNNEVRSLGTERNLGTDPRTKNLTEIIKRTVKGLDKDQSNAVMSYHDRVVKLNLKTLDSATNNITILFDYNTGGWSVDRGQAVNCSVVWDGRLVYGEDGLTGQVFADETGFNADGASFNFTAITPFMDDSRPDTSKRARYIFFRGQQSLEQDLTVRLYRGDYSTYSDYIIPAPSTRGVTTTITNDGQQGSSQQGSAQWGGDSSSGNDITMYRTEELISVDRRGNMFAIGVISTIDGGKVVVEQLELKLIDDNENYKRSDI